MDISKFPKMVVSGSIAPPMFSFFDEEVFAASDCAKFLEAHKDADTIVVEYRSPGGYVAEGFDIHDQLKTSGKRIISIGYRVNSIAVVPFLAAKPEDRFVTENVEFYIHNARIHPMDLGFEALTAEDLEELAEDTKKTDQKIRSFYESVLGSENMSTLDELMNKQTNLGSELAIKYGFASTVWTGETTPATAAKNKLKVRSYAVENFLVNKISNKQQMENERLTKVESKVDKILNSIKKLFIKNEVTVTSGDKTIIVKANEGEDLKGKVAVYADADGLPTDEVVPAGEHTLSDGRILVVGDAGVISEVKAAESIDEVKKELANAIKERDLMKTENESLKGQLKTFETSLNEIKNEMTTLRAEIPGDPDNKPKPRTATTGPGTLNSAPKRKADILINISKERFAEKK